MKFRLSPRDGGIPKKSQSETEAILDSPESLRSELAKNSLECHRVAVETVGAASIVVVLDSRASTENFH